MKANEAPEKLYLEKVYPDNGILPNGLNYNQSPDDIEYTRTDAFIEKACEFLEDRIAHDSIDYPMATHWLIEDFRKYLMK